LGPPARFPHRLADSCGVAAIVAAKAEAASVSPYFSSSAGSSESAAGGDGSDGSSSGAGSSTSGSPASLPPFNVLVTSYEMCLRDAHLLSRFDWQYLVRAAEQDLEISLLPLSAS
jgi:hypothetical protein